MYEKRAPEGARQFLIQTKSELEGVTQAQGQTLNGATNRREGIVNPRRAVNTNSVDAEGRTQRPCRC